MRSEFDSMRAYVARMWADACLCNLERFGESLSVYNFLCVLAHKHRHKHRQPLLWSIYRTEQRFRMGAWLMGDGAWVHGACGCVGLLV